MSFSNIAKTIGLGAGVGTVLIAAPFIASEEGLSLVAYTDPVGVVTVCHGLTNGVNMRKIYTRDECDKELLLRISRDVEAIRPYIKVEITDTTRAAIASFAHNVGVPSVKSSTMIKVLNTGDISGGCYQMYDWHKGGRKDCRVRKNNCFGVWNRRMKEVDMCLKGAR